MRSSSSAILQICLVFYLKSKPKRTQSYLPMFPNLSTLHETRFADFSQLYDHTIQGIYQFHAHNMSGIHNKIFAVNVNRIFLNLNFKLAFCRHSVDSESRHQILKHYICMSHTVSTLEKIMYTAILPLVGKYKRIMASLILFFSTNDLTKEKL